MASSAVRFRNTGKIAQEPPKNQAENPASRIVRGELGKIRTDEI
jgi:hypothetical protein